MAYQYHTEKHDRTYPGVEHDGEWVPYPPFLGACSSFAKRWQRFLQSRRIDFLRENRQRMAYPTLCSLMENAPDKWRALTPEPWKMRECPI